VLAFFLYWVDTRSTATCRGSRPKDQYQGLPMPWGWVDDQIVDLDFGTLDYI